MQTPTLRQATTADAPALLAIYAPYVKDTTITFEYDVPSQDEFAHRIQATTRQLPWLVCEIDGIPVGYAYASPFGERAAYSWTALTSVYVKQGIHGQGIGRLLYTALKEAVRAQGYLTLYARVALPGPQSEAFHKKMGYTAEAVLENVGCKLGQMLHTAYFKKVLRPIAVPTSRPVAFTTLPAATLAQILSGGHPG